MLHATPEFEMLAYIHLLTNVTGYVECEDTCQGQLLRAVSEREVTPSDWIMGHASVPTISIACYLILSYDGDLLPSLW